MTSLPVQKKRKYNNNNPTDPRRNPQSMARRGYSQQQQSFDYRSNHPEGVKDRDIESDTDDSSLEEISNSSSTLRERKGEMSRESTSSGDSSSSEEEKYDSYRGWPNYKLKEPEGRNYEFLKPSPSPRRNNVKQLEPMAVDSSDSGDDHGPTVDALHRKIIRLERKISKLMEENRSVEKRARILVDELYIKQEKIRELKEYHRRSKYKSKFQETSKELNITKGVLKFAYEFMDLTSKAFVAAKIGKEEFGKVTWIEQDLRPDQVEQIHDDKLHVPAKDHNNQMNGVYKIIIRTTHEEKVESYRVTLQNGQNGLLALLRDPYARDLQNMESNIQVALLANVKVKVAYIIWMPNHVKVSTRPGVEIFTHVSFLDVVPEQRRRPVPPRKEPIEEIDSEEEQED